MVLHNLHGPHGSTLSSATQLFCCFKWCPLPNAAVASPPSPASPASPVGEASMKTRSLKRQQERNAAVSTKPRKKDLWQDKPFDLRSSSFTSLSESRKDSGREEGRSGSCGSRAANASVVFWLSAAYKAKGPKMRMSVFWYQLNGHHPFCMALRQRPFCMMTLRQSFTSASPSLESQTRRGLCFVLYRGRGING